MSRYEFSSNPRMNHIMTKDRELYIRSLRFLTLEMISDYMDCSLYVAGVYVKELNLKTNEITCNLIPGHLDNPKKAKKNKTRTDNPI